MTGGGAVGEAALQELESLLAVPLFCGMAMGSTLMDVLNVEAMHERLLAKRRSRPGDWARLLFHSRPRRARGGATALRRGDVVLTWNTEKAHSRELIMPVLRALNASTCTVVCGRPEMCHLLPAAAQGLTWDDLPVASWWRWFRFYSQVAGSWAETCRAFCARHGLEHLDALLLDLLVIQSQRCLAAVQWLQAIQPSAVLTDYDRHQRNIAVVLAARTLRIPTFTLIHGVISDGVGYTPLLADVAFCWGELQRQQLLQLGVTDERLVVAGCPRLCREVAAVRQPVKARLGLRACTVVLLATSPMADEPRRALLGAFATLCRMPDVIAVVRLHPSEAASDYASLQQRWPELRVLSNEVCSQDEALALADVVVAYESGFGNDALVKRVPVVVLCPPPLPMGRNGASLVADAGCPLVRDGNALAEVVGRLCTDEAFRQALAGQAEAFVQRFCVRFGADAAEFIAADLQHRCGLPPST